MTTPLVIDGSSLRICDVVEVARLGREVSLSEDARANMSNSYAWVQKATTRDQPVYGVNTGFGSLARVKIDPAHSSQLSLNLIRSHAAGVGPILPAAETRAIVHALEMSRGAIEVHSTASHHSLHSELCVNACALRHRAGRSIGR